MKVNHLNLTVTDVPEARKFLETYFGLTCEGSRGNGFAVMFDDDGFVLTLMKGSKVQYPKTFHIGFPQENKEQVDQINQRLKEDGFDVEPPKQLHGYTFYVEAPGGFTVEVLC
ncbi:MULTISPECIES: VOC family protein [Bacillus]|uniref:Glyoxalase n=2 Tax=Bacillus TaxID=1386 RepID=A0A0M4FGY9_9BACI|nr:MULTISPECIES: VOC family protein [Bacillus]ALC80217.1 glyoxalase [Bacillus gobiensis]MBP1082795.1 catechol 2,3-dioxygenase-like lactoylglutathione lyase family enzyme [Bacillus capparidis]MED1098438.1 VOC family protein [Bacillus capparidis]